MSHTDRYRQQHSEIMRLATDLGKKLVPSQLAVGASDARRLLSELSGKFIVHLAAEDMLLYPMMLKCKDASAQALAKRFAVDMQPMAQAFKDYAVRWNAAAEIQKNPEGFTNETRGIIKALSERIRKENTELYPLADKL